MLRTLNALLSSEQAFLARKGIRSAVRTIVKLCPLPLRDLFHSGLSNRGGTQINRLRLPDRSRLHCVSNTVSGIARSCKRSKAFVSKDSMAGGRIRPIQLPYPHTPCH